MVKRNIARQAQGSLNSDASGISRFIYIVFELLSIDCCHPKANRLKRWATSPNTRGGAFRLYISHMWKACHVLGADSSRYTDLGQTVLSTPVINRTPPTICSHSETRLKLPIPHEPFPNYRFFASLLFTCLWLILKGLNRNRQNWGGFDIADSSRFSPRVGHCRFRLYPKICPVVPKTGNVRQGMRLVRPAYARTHR